MSSPLPGASHFPWGSKLASQEDTEAGGWGGTLARDSPQVSDAPAQDLSCPGLAPANLPTQPSKKLGQLVVQLRSPRTPRCSCHIQPHAPHQGKHPQLALPPN